MLSVILGLLTLTAGCTFTTTMEKRPLFAGTSDSLQAHLNQLVKCEKFSLIGTEKTTNGKKKDGLEIDVINGTDVPEGDKMIGLARSIGLEVKNALKDTAEYDQYQILFVKVKVNGATTSRSWIGKEFKSADLR